MSIYFHDKAPSHSSNHLQQVCCLALLVLAFQVRIVACYVCVSSERRATLALDLNSCAMALTRYINLSDSSQVVDIFLANAVWQFLPLFIIQIEFSGSL